MSWWTWELTVDRAGRKQIFEHGWEEALEQLMREFVAEGNRLEWFTVDDFLYETMIVRGTGECPFAASVALQPAEGQGNGLVRA